jgi:hypothetical protein
MESGESERKKENILKEQSERNNQKGRKNNQKKY